MKCAGLDFGTSNSTIGLCNGRDVELVPLEQESPVMPSTIFYNQDLMYYFFGQTATAMYMQGSRGRYMKALKSILGTAFEDHKTRIGNKGVALKSLITLYIKNLKDKAEEYLQEEITHVVAGRPVHFCDDDREKDRQARNTLEEILKEAGFVEIHFQYEPFGAARFYERQISREELALIADIGGGTSDFTVIRLSPGTGTRDRKQDILASDSVHLAGNDMDKALNLARVMSLFGYKGRIEDNREAPSWIYSELSTWEMINYFCSNKKNLDLVESLKRNAPDALLFRRLERLVQEHYPFTLLSGTEKAKIELSSLPEAELFFHYVEPGLSHTIKQDEYAQTLIPVAEKIKQKAAETLELAGVAPGQIGSVFFTGGTSSMPLLRRGICSLVPGAREVTGDLFGSVCHGLTILAGELFGGVSREI